MALSDISTELLIKLRERYTSGRTRVFAVAEARDHPEAAAWIQETMIAAVENELRRRLN